MGGDHGSSGDFDGVKSLKIKLEPWKQIVLHANSILIWEKPFFPGVIAGSLTFLYIVLYCMDMSNLTMFSLAGALALILDYSVPMVAPKIFDSSKWSANDEQKFEGICEKLSKVTSCLCKGCSCVAENKQNRPVIFLGFSLVVLLSLAWLGSCLNGFFMAWLASVIVLLLPGFKQHGILDQVTALVSSKFKKQ